MIRKHNNIAVSLVSANKDYKMKYRHFSQMKISANMTGPKVNALANYV